MYNLPEMQSDNRAFWGALKVELSRLGLDDLPDDLDFTRRPVPAEIETDTLFTQVCGYPLQTIYRRQAALLAAPVYATTTARARPIAASSSWVPTRGSSSWRIFAAAALPITVAIPIRA